MYVLHMKSAIISAALLILTFMPLTINAAAHEKDSLRAEDYYIEGVREYCAGNYSHARQHLSASLRLTPENDAALYYLAMISLADNDTDKAMEFLGKASEISPENEWYRLAMAQLYSGIGESDLAIGIYEELIAASPAKSSYYYDLINLLVQNGKLDEALETLDKIELLRGSDEITCNARYQILIQQKRFDEAEAVVRKWTRSFPRQARLCS